ncbi:MAG: thioredoxin domain-containing protein [Deltaproteobacteria bacterium]|nr:thioredoxin domain-containing protein [Deltaproteobacteria bacterium]
MPSALAACAAARQSKFTALDALLWDAYKARSFDKDDTTDPDHAVRCWESPAGCPVVTAMAKSAQLDVARFTRDLAVCKPNVAQAASDMGRFGVGGIPGFFINGRAISGAVPFDVFQKVIDEELALASGRIKQGTRPAQYYQKWVIEKGLKAIEPVAQIPVAERPDPSIIPPRPTPTPVPRPARPMPDPAKTYTLAIDPLDATLGPADAKVTIIEATDYACPFCERVRGTLAQLQTKYGKDLRIVFKQLVVHPANAMPSALASCAAARQKKFAAMDALLWENFKTRSFDLDVPADPNLPDARAVRCWESSAGCPIVTAAAKTAKLDVARFKRDLVTCKANVDRAAADYAKLGVAAIPTFFINGRHLQGAQPVEAFERLIDDELALANERIKKGTKAASYYQQWVVDKGLKSLEPVAP